MSRPCPMTRSLRRPPGRRDGAVATPQGTSRSRWCTGRKYDDWSWAKGKLDPGEEWPVAAARETAEETGLDVHLGMPLPTAEYTVLDRDRRPRDKQVRYWAAEVVGGDGPAASTRSTRWPGSTSSRSRPARLRPRPRPAARGRPRRRRRAADHLAAGGRPARQGGPAGLLDAATTRPLDEPAAQAAGDRAAARRPTA